jgi:STE24 endopeptidase
MMVDRAGPGNEPDSGRQQQAKRYANTKRGLYFAELLLTATLLIMLVLTPLSKDFARLLSFGTVLSALFYFLALMAGYTLVTFPFKYYAGYVLPRRYGLTHQELPGWLGDNLKAGILSLMLGSGIVVAVYLLMEASGLWWLWIWLIAMSISLALSVLAPVLVLPLFFKSRPLPEGELRNELEELAARAKLKVQGIYTVEFSEKTSTANAALMGAGRTRRILLSDTLTNKYTNDEILTVMGHEMGHQRHGDTVRLLVFQGAVLLATFYIASLLLSLGARLLGYGAITDVAALPLLLLIIAVLGLIFSPLLSTFSRFVESRADMYALEITGKPEAFISAMTRLTDQNLGEAEPPRWVELLMDDHPSYQNRVAMARKYASGK